MMSLHHPALVLAAGLLLSASAQAQVGLTADLGTTGLGAHIVVPLASKLNGRFGANYLRHSFTKNSDGIDYDLKGKLRSVDALLDWYLSPGTSFHLTGGLVYNGTAFDATASASKYGSFTINGTRYQASDVGALKGRVDFRKAAPYLGIGWGNALDASRGWSVSADLGTFYQGKANVQLANVGCTASAPVCDSIAKDVEAERARFAQDASSYKFYPVLRVGLSYRF
jgi:hypothetical protein